MTFIDREKLNDFVAQLTDEEKEKLSQETLAMLFMAQIAMQSPDADAEVLFEFANILVLMAELSKYK